VRENRFDWQKIAHIIRWMQIVDTREQNRYNACTAPIRQADPFADDDLHTLVLEAINHPGTPERCPHCFSDEVARFRMPASLRRTCHCSACSATYETPL